VRHRRLAATATATAAGLLMGVLVPGVAVIYAPPAAAAGACTVSADTTAGDYTGTWSDSTPVKIRVLRPTNPGTGGCPAKPAAGWPLIINLHGWGGNRCTDALDFFTRADAASYGYVVLSFTGRGFPGPVAAGAHSAQGCDVTTDTNDSLDDSGNDVAGSRDRLDITQMIDWARDNYDPTGCNPCVDDSKVGLMGGSYGGLRTWMSAVSSPTNPQFDSRVRAAVAGRSWLMWDNVKALTNDGGTNLRPPAAGGQVPHVAQSWSHGATGGHTIPDVPAQVAELYKDRYLNLTVPSATTSFWNDRYLVDDNSAVDKAHLINIPMFVQLGWFDGAPSIANQISIEGWKKLASTAFGNAAGTDKYLYLGSCAHPPTVVSIGEECHANNKTQMHNPMKRFFNRYVTCYGSTSCLTACGSSCEVRPAVSTCAAAGPCVFSTVPPPWISTTNNAFYPLTQTWTEQTYPSWPPSGAGTATYYFRDDGSLQTTAQTGGVCTLPTLPAAGCKEFANLVHAPTYVEEMCNKATAASGEYLVYTSAAFGSTTKIVGLTADLWLSTDTTRMQVNVDVYDADAAGNGLMTLMPTTGKVIPTQRSATSGTKYHFVFQPGSPAATIQMGHKLIVAVTSKYPAAAFPEPIPGKLRLYHNSTDQSKIVLTTVS
jgi:predicted acyl esterase